MAMKIDSVYYVLFIYLAYSRSVTYAFLDIDELKSIKYGINLVNEPVTLDLKGGLEPENGIHVTSKYGQDYKCTFLDQVEADKKKEEEEKVAMETGVSELLKPMKSVPCLFKTRDWWSYEFCYEKHIRQFHLENGQISGNVMMLGYYESEFDWNNETNKEVFNKHSPRLNRYHTQQYVNGSKCDLTGKPRKTEVRFVCEEGTADYIVRLDEPETCSYILTIHTSRICRHPYLKPPERKRPVPITCNPIITQEEYQVYLQEVAEKKKAQEKLEEEEKLRKEEEQISKPDVSLGVDDGISTQETDIFERMGKLKPVSTKKGENSRSFEFQDIPEMNIGDISKIQKLIQDELNEDMEKLSEKLGGQKLDAKMKIKVIENMDDLQEVLKTARQEAKALGKKKSMMDETEENSITGDDTSDNTKTDQALKFERKSFSQKMQDSITDLDKELDEVDKMVIKEFEKELDDNKLAEMRKEWKKNKNSLKSIKDSIRETMEVEFDKIMEEAENEAGVEIEDRLEAHRHLAATLNKLMTRLEKTEKDISEVDKELEDISRKNVQLQEKIKKDEVTEIQEKMKESQDTEEGVKGPSKSVLPGSPDDDKIKVRVTKIKSSDLDKQSLKSSPQTEQLEQEVKDGLEKAGLELGNGKIHVKIITAGYYDEKDDSVHVLSQEDTSAFKNMIVSILGGDQEASREEKKQQTLEENYSVVWGKKKDKQ